MKLQKIIMIILLGLLFSKVILAERYLSSGTNTYTYFGSEVDMGSNYIDHWASHNYSWFLNQNGAGDGLSISDVEQQAILSHSVWTSSSISSTDLSISYAGRTSTTWGEDGVNTVCWAESGDPAYASPNGPLYVASGAGGITIVKVNSNYEFIEVDIVMNGRDKTWIIAGLDYDKRDIRGCLTHEVGHSIGLGHPSSPTSPSAQTMWGFVDYPDDPRDLTWDDSLGVSFLYGGNICYDKSVEEFTSTFKWPVSIMNGVTFTLNREVVFQADLQVNGNLIVNPGTEIKFENNSCLYVNGTISAIGPNQIYFDFVTPGYLTTQNGMFINPSGSATLINCTIKNAYKGVSISTLNSCNLSNCSIYNNTVGIYCASSSPSLDHLTILDNFDGIYLNNSSPGISYCLIRNNSRMGIHCFNYSSPAIYHCSGVIYPGSFRGIWGHVTGVYANEHSSPKLGEFGPGENKITDNEVGIYANAYSRIDAGWAPDGGVNGIYANESYNVFADNNSTIIAQNNWWGAPPYTSKFGSQNNSSISYLPVIDPYVNPITKAVSQIYVSDDSFIDEELKQAVKLQYEKKYDEAIGLYKKILNNALDTKKGLFCLSSLNECYEKSDKNDFRNFLSSSVKNKITRKGNMDQLCSELDIRCDILEKNYVAALEKYSKMLTDYTSNEDVIKRSLFNRGFIYHSYLKDSEKAECEFTILESLFPDDNLVIDSKILLGKEITAVKNINNDQVINLTSSSNQYKLFDNFPNPFNPTTKIMFKLLKQGVVSLKVYDMIGKEVETLVNGFKPEGLYSIYFNGSNLSSGLYLYELRSGEFVSTKKMLLIK